MECAYHRDRVAVSKCKKCGKPPCGECCAEGNLCEGCLSEIETGGETLGRKRLLNWKGWLYSIIFPGRTFRGNRAGASLAGVAMNILAGLVLAGIIAFLLVSITGNPLMSAFDYTTQFLIFVCIWLVNSLVAYSFSMLTGGMGSIKQHLYLLSLPLPLSPLLILFFGTLLNLSASSPIAEMLVVVLIIVYVVNLQLSAVKEAHKFGNMQAAVSGLVPLALSGAVVGLLIFVLSRK